MIKSRRSTISNSYKQKNECLLKEIGWVCEIEKELNFQIEYYTFATTLTVTNGIPIENVSKMLGHKKLRSTQQYAKVLNKKVSYCMKILREKFNTKENQLI